MPASFWYRLPLALSFSLLTTTAMGLADELPTRVELGRHSLSQLSLPGNGGPVEVFLYAPDQEVEVLTAPYCGGLEGSRRYTGHFHLVSVRGERVLSEFALPDHYYFVGGYTHGGLHKVEELQEHSVFALYQYAGCNNEKVEFFRVETAGRITRAQFLQRDGWVKPSEMTGPRGDFEVLPDGDFVFCHYDNRFGYSLCDTYKFDGRDFLQTALWMKSKSPSGHAERALYEFLVALQRQEYQAAAYYYAGTAAMDREQKARDLQEHCSRAESRCWLPQYLVLTEESASPPVFRFAVTLYSYDQEEQPQFVSRVEGTADGWKVLDLPRAEQLPTREELAQRSLSQLSIRADERPVNVFLYAPDERTEVLHQSYCGGKRGARSRRGNYRLVSAAAGEVLSQLPLGDHLFVEGQPHDRLRSILAPRTGQTWLAIYQYGNCNLEYLKLFRVQRNGHIVPVPFVWRDGRRHLRALTGPDGEIRETSDGAVVLCHVDNALEHRMCDAYVSDGLSLRQREAWMTTDLSSPPAPTRATEAKRALAEFLLALHSKEFATAAFYYEATPEEPGEAPAEFTREMRAGSLEDYCTRQGKQCLRPDGFLGSRRETSAGETTVEASFLDGEGRRFRLNGGALFQFRLVRRPYGWKVLNLPPTGR